MSHLPRDHGGLLVALADLPEATPTLERLAAAAGLEPAAVRAAVATLEPRGWLETWPDLGTTRVVLGPRSIAFFGLALSRDGSRWEPAPAGVGRG